LRSIGKRPIGYNESCKATVQQSDVRGETIMTAFLERVGAIVLVAAFVQLGGERRG
jgi:hypothetical protein